MEFDFRCVYCLAAEREVAPLETYGGFEIDHFRPQAKFRHLRHEIANLLWSCKECNRAKRSKWPTIELERLGNRIVDPSSEGLGKHLEVTGLDHRVEHKTQAGWYTARCLNLNSDLHRTRRRERAEKVKKAGLMAAFIENQLGQIARLEGEGKDVSTDRDLLILRQERLAELFKALAPPPPFDAPVVCNICPPPNDRIDRSKQLGIRES